MDYQATKKGAENITLQVIKVDGMQWENKTGGVELKGGAGINK